MTEKRLFKRSLGAKSDLEEESSNEVDNHDLKPPKREIISEFIHALLMLLYVATCISVLGLLIEQTRHWLKYGRLPERDLHWLFADSGCAATSWKHIGFAGKDYCRPDYVQFTDWIGVNKVLNYVFDQNLLWLVLVLVIVVLLVPERIK